MTTISPTAFGGTTVRPSRRSRTTSTSTSLLADLDLAPPRPASPVVETADANTAELLLASTDLAARRAARDRSPWLATALVLAGVLAAVMVAVVAAIALSPLLVGF